MRASVAGGIARYAKRLLYHTTVDTAVYQAPADINYSSTRYCKYDSGAYVLLFLGLWLLPLLFPPNGVYGHKTGFNNSGGK